MFNKELYINRMNMSGYKPSHIIKTLGISKACYYFRLSGKTKFTAEEVSKISKLFNLKPSEVDAIFFAKQVAD